MVLAVNPARAADNWTFYPVWIREAGQDILVKIAVTPGKVVEFANGENCGAGHKTKQNRFYNHIHINLPLPQTGKDNFNTSYPVTNTNIKAYWDNWYGSGYTSSGSESLASNCHGYALAKNTWIEDPSYIDADELTAATDWPDTKVLRGGQSHSIKVDKYTPWYYFGGTVYTSEKNQASRIYSTSWGYMNPPYSPSGRMKWKP